MWKDADCDERGIAEELIGSFRMDRFTRLRTAIQSSEPLCNAAARVCVRLHEILKRIVRSVHALTPLRRCMCDRHYGASTVYVVCQGYDRTGMSGEWAMTGGTQQWPVAA
jgi:hypothetical protein